MLYKFWQILIEGGVIRMRYADYTFLIIALHEYLVSLVVTKAVIVIIKINLFGFESYKYLSCDVNCIFL